MTDRNRKPEHDKKQDGPDSTKPSPGNQSSKGTSGSANKRGKKKTGKSGSTAGNQKTSKRTNKTMTSSAEKDAKPAAEEPVATPHVEPAASSATAAPVVVQSGSSGKGVSWLALLVSLAALGGAGYAWYQTAVNAKLSGGEQSNRIANIEQRVADFGAEQAGVGGLIDQIGQRVSTAETGVVDQVSQVKQLVSTTETALVSQISEVKQQMAKTESAVGEQIRNIRSESSEQLQAIRADNSEQQKRVEQQVAAADSGLKDQTAAFRSEFEQLSSSIVELRNELGTSISGWSLREIEHLLLLANQRMQLGSSSSDARVALSALQIADQRLKDMDNPALVDTRKALSSEIAALSAVETVDLVRVSSTLGLLSDTLRDLPMKGVSTPGGPVKSESAVAAPSASTADQLSNAGKSFLSDLANLVQVEKGGQPVLPNIAPEVQSLHLAQGHLIMEAAHIALVRQQPEIFVERLGAAESWVNDHVIAGSEQATNWLAQLAEAKKAPVTVSYPDISASLAALRAVIGKEG